MKKIIYKLWSSKFWWLLLLIVLIVINIISSLVYFRFDLTKEKRFTLSEATTTFVRKLEEPIQIEVYLKGDFPSGFQKMANTTEDFLMNLKRIEGSKINYQFISPLEIFPGTNSVTYRDTLLAMGISPINLTVQLSEGQQQKLVFPTAIISYKGQQAIVNLYPEGNSVVSQNEINSAEAQLEYQFLKTFHSLLKPAKPLVAYSVGNGEPTGPETFAIQESLKNNFQLFTFNIAKQTFIPDTFNVLMIVKPSIQFTEDEKLKIDQFVMRGGNVLFFVDALNAEQDSLRNKMQTVAYDRNLNLEDLLFQYGIRINQDLVMDLQCDFLEFVVGGSASNPQTEFLQWNYFPVFQSTNSHIINRGLNLLRGQYVNSVDTISANGIKKTILLSSSTNSRTISTPALISLNENKMVPQDEKFNQNSIPVAALLEGSFQSIYKYRVGKMLKDSLVSLGVPFKENSPLANKIIVVADGDFVLNEISSEFGPLPMGWNKYTYTTFSNKSESGKYFIPMANANFLKNCLEYLTNDVGIIEAGNKEIAMRLLDSKKVKEQKLFWQLFNVGFPVIIIVFAGIIFQYFRKRKYTI